MPRTKTPRRLSGRPPKHAGRLLQRTLREGRIDGRTQIARIRRDLEAALLDDLGGVDHVSTAQRLLVDRAVATALVCSAFETHVFAAESPVDSAGAPLPVLRSYVSHVAQLTRTLGTLGLERLERAPIDLASYIATASTAVTRDTAQNAQTSRRSDAPPDTEPDEPDGDGDAPGGALSSDTDDTVETAA